MLRMVLDLNRILYYADRQGRMTNTIQRRMGEHRGTPSSLEMARDRCARVHVPAIFWLGATTRVAVDAVIGNHHRVLAHDKWL